VAREVFEQGLGGAPNQLERQRDDVNVSAAELLDLQATPGGITEQGLRTDVNVGFQYVSFWLGGRGAAAINSMMEDAATAEISRSQIWQWVRNGKVDERDVHVVEDAELERLRDGGRWDDARKVFEQVALGEEFAEFLTLPAYDHLD
jgi:malate synthase